MQSHLSYDTRNNKIFQRDRLGKSLRAMHWIAQQTTMLEMSHVKNEPRSAPRVREVSSLPMFYRIARRIIESKFRCSLRARTRIRSGLNSLWNTISLHTGIFLERTKWESPWFAYEFLRGPRRHKGGHVAYTGGGHKYAVTPVWAKFFKKFGTDFLLDEDVRLRLQPVINKLIIFRDYSWNGTAAASFKSKSG